MSPEDKWTQDLLDSDSWRADKTSLLTREIFKTKPGSSNPKDYQFVVVAKDHGVFSGVLWLDSLKRTSNLSIRATQREGDAFTPSSVLVKGSGTLEQVLGVERSLLNVLSHLCGVATQTKKAVAEVQQAALARGLAQVPQVLHTRKFSPHPRSWQVAAVLAGGGAVHRKSLSDRVFVKENHKHWMVHEGWSFGEYLSLLLAKAPDAVVEVENKTELSIAVRAGAKHVLLDNFSPQAIAEAVSQLPPTVEVEISGGLKLGALSPFVIPGVHRMSLGALTHSVKSVDLSLDGVFL